MERTPPAARLSRPLIVLAVLASIAALHLAAEVLIPVAVSILLAFALGPFVRRLERLHIPRVPAAFTVMGVFVAIVVALGWVLHGQALQLASDLPGYKYNISTKLAAFRGKSTDALDRATRTIKELGDELSGPPKPGENGEQGPPEQVATPTEPLPVRVVGATVSPIVSAEAIIGPLITRAATAAIVIVFTTFILIQREDLRNRLVRLMGDATMHKSTPALDDAASRVSRYLLLQLVVNSIAGVLVGIGLTVLEVPGALLWGVLTIALRFIPFIGTFVAAAFPIIISMAVAPDWRGPLMVAAMITIVEVVCGQVIEPLLFASGTGLSPIAVLASALFWGWLWGPVGLLLATPIAVCLAVAGQHFPRLSTLSVILSDRVALAPPARLYQRLLAGDAEEASRIVTQFRKDKPSLIETYDQLVMPALRMAQTARNEGNLEQAQERSVRDIVAAIVDDTAPHQAAPDGAAVPIRPAVICVPARDEPDAAAAAMLAQSLTTAGVTTQTASTSLLTSELLDLIEKSPAPRPLICISAVPPSAAMHARVIAKRLLARFPDLPVVIGLWDGNERSDEARAALGAAGTGHIVTTLTQAIATITAIVGKPAVALDAADRAK